MQVLENILRDSVLKAGDTALKLAKKGPRRWLKADGTPVTEADLEADRILHEALAKAPIKAGWQSEESAPEAPEDEYFWLTDPIDGTREFANGGDGWCVSVALVKNGSPVLAAIYAPVKQLFFTACAGQGAFQNEQAIATTNHGPLEGAQLLGNMSLARKFPEAKVEGLHALALRLAHIANGSHDGMAAFGPKQDWDIAAGDLLVREAGGISSDLQGNALIYGRKNQARSGVVAAGAHLHGNLIARTAEPTR